MLVGPISHGPRSILTPKPGKPRVAALGLFDKLVRWFSTWDTHGLSFVVGICKQGDCSKPYSTYLSQMSDSIQAAMYTVGPSGGGSAVMASWGPLCMLGLSRPTTYVN